MPRLRVCLKSLLWHVCFAFFLCVVCVVQDHAHAQDSDPANVGKPGVDEQARWLANATANGTLAALDDDRLTVLFRSLDPRALPRAICGTRIAMTHPTEFTMRRRERIKGKWPKRADHMLVRVTRCHCAPMRIAARWRERGPGSHLR